MISPTYESSERGVRYQPIEEQSFDYTTGQQTGITGHTIVVDKRKYITNYINLTVTGEQSELLHTITSEEQAIYTNEARLCQDIDRELEGMLENIDDPCIFEQKLGNVLCKLDDLGDQITSREVGFSDLHGMLKLGLASLECSDVTKEGIAAIRNAIKCLSHKVTGKTLQNIRAILRENSIDILKPLKSDINVNAIMKEIFPNETTTRYNSANPPDSLSPQ